jgi:type II secretory pathway pseudopilin PulG
MRFRIKWLNRKIQNNKGLILTEILFAIVIISIVLIVSIQSIMNILRAAKTCNNLITASILSQKLLSEIYQNTKETSTGIFEDNPNFSWKLTKSSSDFNEVNQYVYYILWKENGREKTLKFSTFLYNKNFIQQ